MKKERGASKFCSTAPVHAASYSEVHHASPGVALVRPIACAGRREAARGARRRVRKGVQRRRAAV